MNWSSCYFNENIEGFTLRRKKWLNKLCSWLYERHFIGNEWVNLTGCLESLENELLWQIQFGNVQLVSYIKYLGGI